MDSKTAHISEGAVALEELDACDSLEGVAEYGNLEAATTFLPDRLAQVQLLGKSAKAKAGQGAASVYGRLCS